VEDTGIPKGIDGVAPARMVPLDHQVCRFKSFTANLTSGELLNGETPIDVETKVFQMLALLLRCPGSVVSYQEFKDAIWPDVVVELAENVNVLASKLRDTLGESKGSTRCVLNKRGEGYYFNPKVKVDCLTVNHPDVQADLRAAPPQAAIPRRKMLLPILAGTGIIMTAAVYGVVRLGGRRNRPTDWRVAGSTLTVLDENGRELWHHTFPSQMDRVFYRMPSNENRCVFIDLDRDGVWETLFIYYSDNQADRGKLVCFTGTGKIRWEFFTKRKVVDAQSREWAPPYIPCDFAIIISKSGSARVVFTSVHYWSFPSHTVVLDSAGKLLGEFWHRGHLNCMASADLRGDGFPQLLLGGVNDAPEYRQATLLVFDPEKLAGSSCSPAGETYFQNLGPGTQTAEMFFPRTPVSRGQEFTRVAQIIVADGRITVLTAESIVQQDINRVIYDLDFQLNVIDAFLTDPIKARYHELEARGQIPKGSIASEGERLKKEVRIVRSS
jgi:DNA-binding winged helix-turn-helix (wHTH) protein